MTAKSSLPIIQQITPPEIAKSLGAKVIVPDELGYGNAYRILFEEASGDYIVMGDGDGFGFYVLEGRK